MREISWTPPTIVWAGSCSEEQALFFFPLLGKKDYRWRCRNRSWLYWILVIRCALSWRSWRTLSPSSRISWWNWVRSNEAASLSCCSTQTALIKSAFLSTTTLKKGELPGVNYQFTADPLESWAVKIDIRMPKLWVNTAFKNIRFNWRKGCAVVIKMFEDSYDLVTFQRAFLQREKTRNSLNELGVRSSFLSLSSVCTQWIHSGSCSLRER